MSRKSADCGKPNRQAALISALIRGLPYPYFSEAFSGQPASDLGQQGAWADLLPLFSNTLCLMSNQYQMLFLRYHEETSPVAVVIAKAIAELYST